MSKFSFQCMESLKINKKKLFSLIFILVIYPFTFFGQQIQPRPEIRTSEISFSDIAKNEILNPVPLKQFIGNDRKEKEDEEELPEYDVPAFTPFKQDPFGKILSKGIIDPSPLSPAPALTFNAIDDNNSTIPPDVNGAVGPNHIMTTLNSQVRIQNLTGTTISTVSLNAFWASVGNPGTFDPKILYEPFNNRWIFSAAANGGAANSAVLIGVSQTSDPTGVWNLYSFDADASNANWFDFPSLGFNKNWIVVTGNMFTISGNSFTTGILYIIKKSDLYAHVASPVVTVISNINGATMSPAATYDNNISTEYLLQRWSGNSGGNGYIKLYTITGAFGSEVLSAGTLIGTPNPWTSNAPLTDFAPQSGTTTKINLNDDRMSNTVYRNGSIWGVHTVFLPTSGVTRSAVQWWQLNTSGAIIQRGRIDDATGTNFFAFPSIAVNTYNDAVIGYAKFSSGIFASACFAMRLSADPVNIFQSEFLFKAGLAKYVKTYGGTRNRWGDYTATMTDPAGFNFWTIQEYAATPGGGNDRWGTWWAKIAGITCTPANPVSVSITANPSGSVCSGTTVSFTATPTNPGTTPSYQWIKNGTSVGINSAAYSDNTITNGSQITCIMTSNITCATGNPDTSNIITMTVNAVDDFNACTNDVCNSASGTVTHNPISVDDGNACTTDACSNSITTSTVTINGATGLPLIWSSTTPNAPGFDIATLNVNTFPASTQITNMSATINLAHTRGGDMQIFLFHPNTLNNVAFVNDATDSQLQFGFSSGIGPSLPYTFSSTGSTMAILSNPNTANYVPSPGPFKPVDASGAVTTFGTFNGLSPNGIWTLFISDDFTDNGGTVELLSLTITASSSAAVITHTAVNLSDGNPCTNDFCNSETGTITHSQISIDDNNACTTDACNSTNGVITHSTIPTDDGNSCTTDACNSNTGAITHNAVMTDDGNACTNDACNTSSGEITHTAVSINDGNACTTDACNTSTGTITHTQVSTDDGNVCTTDACNSISGVINHISSSTNDGNACTIDGCNSISGIFHNPVNSDDGNACTTDLCNSSTGAIRHIPLNVDDENACTIDDCNTSTGFISHTPVVIDDSNSCTTDACDPETGNITHTPSGCGVSFNSKIFLEGFYTGGGLMNNLLYNFDQSKVVKNPSITFDMTDSITISVMDDIPFSHALINSKVGILKSNGDVNVIFDPSVIANNNYYIKINHRNHIETWSAVPIQLTAITTYNFHTARSQAYGSNQALTFDAVYAAMYCGDINQDGAVDGSDFILFDPDNQNALGGYEISDLNGDGAVDGSDFLVYDPNNQNGIGVTFPIP